MVKITNIKIITGFKGGVGKTLTSLSLVIKSIRDNNKTIAIDLNANNPDLADTLTNLYNEDYQIRDEYFRWQFPIDDTNKQLIVIKPKVSKWDAKSIWDFISLIVANEEHNASNVIVDTHLSLARLYMEQNYPQLNGKKIQTYHLWNFGSPDKPKEMKDIENVVKSIEDKFPEYSARQQIHIFNPSEAKKHKKFFGRSLRRQWKKNMDANESIAISIDTLIKMLGDINIEFDYRTELSPSKLFEVFKGFFLTILDKVEKKSIVNLLPIFEHLDLSNFTTGQVYSKNRNIRGIQDDMDGFYDYIYDFEQMRKDFGL